MGSLVSIFVFSPCPPFALDYRTFTLSRSLSPLPSDIDLRRSFRLRARCRTSTLRSFTASYLITGRSSRTMPRALSPAGHPPFRLRLPFPPPLSRRSVQCIAMDSDSSIYIPKPCFAEEQATAAHISPILFACVFGQPWPILVSFYLCFLVALVIRPDSSHRHSSQLPANPCVSPPHCPLILRLDRRAIAPCSSGNNKPRTPPPSYFSRAFSVRECRPGFIPLSALRILARTSTPPYSSSHLRPASPYTLCTKSKQSNSPCRECGRHSRFGGHRRRRRGGGCDGLGELGEHVGHGGHDQHRGRVGCDGRGQREPGDI